MEYCLFLSLSQLRDGDDVLSLYLASNKILRNLLISSSIHIPAIIPCKLLQIMKKVIVKGIFVEYYEKLDKSIFTESQRYQRLYCEDLFPISSLFVQYQEIFPINISLINTSEEASEVNDYYEESNCTLININKDNTISIGEISVGQSQKGIKHLLAVILQINRNIKSIETASIIRINKDLPRNLETKFICRPIDMDSIMNDLSKIMNRRDCLNYSHIDLEILSKINILSRKYAILLPCILRAICKIEMELSNLTILVPKEFVPIIDEYSNNKSDSDEEMMRIIYKHFPDRNAQRVKAPNTYIIPILSPLPRPF